MKFIETLSIGVQTYRIIHRDIIHEVSSVGRAVFQISTKDRPSGVVRYRCGYAHHQQHVYFLGFIQSAQQNSSISWTVHCRELIAGLNQTAHVSLRQCLIPDVLSDVSKATGVQFADNIAAGLQKPRFASHSNGLHAIQMLARVFEILDFVFWQQNDGKVWLGAWRASAYADKILTIDDRFFDDVTPTRAILPALPMLRVGMQINERRIQSLRLTQEHKSMIRWTQ